jgi:hypothetical protein
MDKTSATGNDGSTGLGVSRAGLPSVVLGAKTCAVCLEDEKATDQSVLFQAPCGHFYHFHCLHKYYEHGGKFKCTYRCEGAFTMSRANTPAFSLDGSIAEMEEESMEDDQDNESTFNICDYCGGEESGFKCDLCQRDLCGECDIVKTVGNFRWDTCAGCVLKFHTLTNVHHAKISASAQIRQIATCDICHHGVSKPIHIKNGQENYCIPCVTKFGQIYTDQQDTVDEIRNRYVS